MEKKRSFGVTVFAFLGFFVALSTILINPSKVVLYSLSFTLVIILLSYNLLKLKKWSRIILLIINGIAALCGLLTSIVIIWLILTNANIQNVSFVASLRMLYPLSAQKQIWKSLCPYLPILTPILFVIMAAYIYGFIIFFTRPKVKEQFK